MTATNSDMAPREVVADVARTARLEERQAHAKEHAARLAAMFDAPTIKEVSVREWRAHYWVAGELQSALISQAFNQQPDLQGRILKLQIQVTCHHQTYPHNVKQLALFGDYDVMDLVAFMGLDTLAPDEITWRDVTRYRTILTVQEVVARSTTRLPN